MSYLFTAVFLSLVGCQKSLPPQQRKSKNKTQESEINKELYSLSYLVLAGKQVRVQHSHFYDTAPHMSTTRFLRRVDK